MLTKRSFALPVVLALLFCVMLAVPALADDTTPSITFDKTSLTLSVDATEQLLATVKKGGLVDGTTQWASDNPLIADVDGTGKVSAKAVGIANVTLSFVSYPTVKATCRVEVVSSSTIKLNVTSITLDVGNSFTITPIINPDTAKPAYYSSSNTAICSVDNTGKITAIASGSAIIIVSNAHGVKAYCTVTVSGGTVPSPTPTPTPAIIPTGVPGTGIAAYVNTVKGSLNLRVYPNTAAHILRTIPQYAPFVVLEYGVNWCKAMYNGTVGYVMTKFVRLAGPTPVVPVVTPTPTPVIPTTPPTVKGQARVVTPSGSLNLRTAPSQYSPRILLIPRSAIVNIISFDYDWCQVEYNGFQGYVMSKFLNLDISQPVPPAVPTTSPDAKYAQVVTVQGGLNMRKSASSGSKRILVIPQYALVQVQEVGSKWCYVTYNGYSGYVMTKYLKM